LAGLPYKLAADVGIRDPVLCNLSVLQKALDFTVGDGFNLLFPIPMLNEHDSQKGEYKVP